MLGEKASILHVKVTLDDCGWPLGAAFLKSHGTALKVVQFKWLYCNWFWNKTITISFYKINSWLTHFGETIQQTHTASMTWYWRSIVYSLRRLIKYNSLFFCFSSWIMHLTGRDWICSKIYGRTPVPSGIVTFSPPVFPLTGPNWDQGSRSPRYRLITPTEGAERVPAGVTAVCDVIDWRQRVASVEVNGSYGSDLIR